MGMPAATIHIVDDDDIVRDSLKVLLESRGYSVEDYASGRDFLSRRNGNAACLVLDNHMPEMTGLDILRTLRQAGDNIGVIMITGRWDAATRAQAEALGVVAFLDKPVPHQRLFSEIDRALSLRAS
ncbi:MAG: response regulator [Rhodospirillaceae bacterium]|nr:response regulator [Rhodospirillaceae bacterium]